MKSTVFIVIFSLIASFTFGQIGYSTKSRKAIKLYENAQLLLRQRKFPEAIEKLNNAVAKDNDFIEAHLKLAFSYELLRNVPEQQHHLEEIIRIAPNSYKYKNAYYSLGKVYFKTGKYEKSAKMLQELQRMGITNQHIRASVDDLQTNIDFALENLRKPLDIHPEPLPEILNTFPLQYFPVLTADENTIIYTARTGVSFSHDENIMISEKDENGHWQKPVSISPNINSQFNEGTCAISADGRTLIFTNCEGRPSVGGCDLYITYKTGEEWSVPENLGENINSRSWDSQPTLSADGRKLFFISDRSGGYGKRDIWMSQLNADQEWQKAVNLGPGVNSKEDEVSPFIHVNGTTLFFASEGFPGFGGFDLYKSELKDGIWSRPKNLGYPVNTHEDQVSLFVSTNGKNGYYSFERTGKDGKKQSLLYGFEFPQKGILDHRSIYLTGNVYDAETKEPLDAKIELFDLGSEEPLAIFTSDPVTGEYLSILNEESKIALYIEREGYLFESESFDVKVDDSDKIKKDIYLKPIKKGNTVRLNNIFFEFNSARLTQNSETELNKIVSFLSINPDVKILISGHTDNQGTESYNLDLSEKRAKAVYEFLLNHGISSDNLTYKGFGESQPLATNDTEEGQKTNRRIEFSIEEN